MVRIINSPFKWSELEINLIFVRSQYFENFKTCNFLVMHYRDIILYDLFLCSGHSVISWL
jgi:hypothetical protein